MVAAPGCMALYKKKRKKDMHQRPTMSAQFNTCSPLYRETFLGDYEYCLTPRLVYALKDVQDLAVISTCALLIKNFKKLLN